MADTDLTAHAETLAQIASRHGVALDIRNDSGTTVWFTGMYSRSLPGWKAARSAVLAAKGEAVAALAGIGGKRHARHGSRTVWGVYTGNDVDGARCGIRFTG